MGEESGKNGYWEKEGSVVVRSPSFSTLTIYDLPGVEPFSVETMDTRSLLLKEQWADIYVHYLCAQMELYSGNLSMYANHAALFNQRFSEYVRLLYDNRPAAPKACTVFRNIE